MEERNTSALVDTARNLFEAKFGPSEGSMVVFAPGRVNLIGEHTDYNGGFVMPLALRLKTIIVGRGKISPRDHENATRCRIVSASAQEAAEFKADDKLAPGEIQWANYVKGVVAAYMKDVPPGHALSFDAAFASDVPMGAGLSSSAALEVSTATLLEEITGVRVGGVGKALRCQWSDHNFMNTPCGIMDQFVSSLAREASTLLVDCRSNTFEAVPLDDNGVVFVVANSGIKHEHAEGAYGERVRQCQEAVEVIKRRHPAVTQLRDTNMAWVKEIEGEVDEKVFRRARHVVSEDRRTLCCAMALRRKDYSIVGSCMNESHESLRDDYEVSVPELDLLVAIAMEVDGVFGSRMTGGGFGGCTVTLVKREAVDELMSLLRQKFRRETSKDPDCFVTQACNGAGVLVPASQA